MVAVDHRRKKGLGISNRELKVAFGSAPWLSKIFAGISNRELKA